MPGGFRPGTSRGRCQVAASSRSDRCVVNGYRRRGGDRPPARGGAARWLGGGATGSPADPRPGPASPDERSGRCGRPGRGACRCGNSAAMMASNSASSRSGSVSTRSMNGSGTTWVVMALPSHSEPSALGQRGHEVVERHSSGHGCPNRLHGQMTRTSAEALVSPRCAAAAERQGLQHRRRSSRHRPSRPG